MNSDSLSEISISLDFNTLSNMSGVINFNFSLFSKTTSIVKKSPVKESLGSASRAIAPATPKQPIIEANEAFARMQKIAGIRK
jgi:hypothetical protein